MARITVITSTLNVLPLLKHTADSVFRQTIGNFQWIIADGASTDGTVNWLAEISDQNPNVVFISEPDSGIYDAWNKVVSLIDGDWVIFLGAGDAFAESSTLETFSDQLDRLPSGKTLAYGSVWFVDDITKRTGRLFQVRWAGVRGPWTVARPTIPSHQGIFHRSELFEQGFRFDTRCRIAADNEIVLRELLAGRGAELQGIVARKLWDGISSRRCNRFGLIREVIYINRKVGIFWTRPFLQLGFLAANGARHLWRRFGLIDNLRN
jgi:glycosyltransferase involved in cell wall biosynthesis